MNYPKIVPFSKRRLALFLSVPLISVALTAQDADDDGVTELSPFTVDAGDANGYRANNTLGGTRLKTSLKDVGASLTVLTEEFMEDLGVTSFDEALIFTPSVDSFEGGDNENSGRSQGQVVRYGTGQAYTIRGFNSNSGEQSISHDFFGALDPSDNYNLERVTLSLGPNSLLIGVGNPQGVAVTSTKRAHTNRQSTKVTMRLDSEDSRRVSFDHNQPLIEDKLAVRVMGLKDIRREFRPNEGKNQDRLTIAFTAKPLENTTLRLNHERYDLDTNTSSLIWGFDGRSLRWAQAGKPTVDFVNQGLAWGAAGMTFVDHNGDPVPVAPGVDDEDGFIDSKADFDPNNGLGQDGTQRIAVTTGLGGNQLINYLRQGNLQVGRYGYQGGNAYQGSVDPWVQFGLRKETNLNGGTWEDPSIQEEGDWTQFFLEHKLAEGLYVELGASRANHFRILDPTFLTQVQVDPNRYLPDGSFNPGYLSAYVHQGAGQRRFIDTTLEEYRATISYELDLTERNRWLGSHNFAGLYQDSETNIDRDIQRLYNYGTMGVPGWNANATGGPNIIAARAYFIDGNEPVIPDLNYILRNRADLEGRTSIGATAAEQGLVSDIENHNFISAQKARSTTESISLGWQGRWLDNKLITVVGYREDDVDSFGGVSDNRNVLAPPYADDTTYVANHNYFTTAPNLAIDPNPIGGKTPAGISRTYGAVYHVTDWFSLTYNESTNFLPIVNPGVENALGEALPNGLGETQEYGFMLHLLEDKLSVSVKKFETAAANKAGNSNSGAGGFKNILNRLDTNYAEMGDSNFSDFQPGDVLYPIREADLNDVTSFTADGYELSAVYNPSNKWRMAFSASDNTNVNTERFPGLVRYISETNTKFEGVQSWANFSNELFKVAGELDENGALASDADGNLLLNGTASSSFDLDPQNGEDAAQALADGIYIANQLSAGVLNLQNIQNLIGVTSSRNGQYAANALVTRIFREGRMKGWSIGGNGRWRSGSIVGYESILDDSGDRTGQYDATKPWKGESFLEFGAFVAYKTKLSNDMNLTVQLNIQNLFDDQDVKILKSDYDLAGYNGPADEVVPVLYQLRRPRKFILSTTIAF